MANLKKVRTGDDLDISADTYNAFIDAVVFARQNGAGPGRPQSVSRQTTVVRVLNDSGVALKRFDAVRIKSVVTPPSGTDESAPASIEFIGNVCFKVDKPATEGLFRDSWLVLVQPLSAGDVGLAVMSGITPCVISIKKIEDTHCDVKDATTVPVSGASGCAKILWVAGGVGSASATGNQLALIDVGTIEWPWIVVTDADGAPGPNSYTVNVFLSPFATEPVATGVNALNTWEIGNSSSGGCGYSFVTAGAACGDIIGLEELPTGCFFKAIGKTKKDGNWAYLFSERLDPKIKINP